MGLVPGPVLFERGTWDERFTFSLACLFVMMKM